MIRTASRITAAVAGIGSVAGGALLAMHGGTTLAASPAATTAAAATTATTATAAPAATPGAATCTDGPWRLDDGANVQGRPDTFARGAGGATYIWHDDSGWHLRTTDVRKVDHHYTGTIVLSRDASFVAVRPMMLEKDDRVYVDGNNVLHYSFDTYAGIDGLDFRVSSCDGNRANERMTFHLTRDGSDDDRRRIDLGDLAQHPETATFTAVRTA